MSVAHDAAQMPLPPARRFSFALAGFVILSIFAHGATFLLFQVVYPQRVTIPPPAPQVTLLTGATPEERALLHWADAEDPALVAATAAPMPPDVFKVRYEPSFSVLRTPPRTVSPPSERLEPAPSPITFPLLLPKPAETAPAHSAAPVLTVVRLSGGLGGRQLTLPPLTPRFSNPLETVQFLLGVDQSGAVRHAILQRSSGDPAADDLAATLLAAARTTASAEGAPIAWGFATVSWGAEVYLNPPATP